MLDENDKPHPYLNSSEDLKPDFLSSELWAPVWENFLISVGKTAASFQHRMSAVSTLLSNSGRRVNLVNDLIQFQLDIANGKLTGEISSFSLKKNTSERRISQDKHLPVCRT